MLNQKIQRLKNNDKTLTTVSFRNGNLSDTDLQTLFEALTKNTVLTQLMLMGNKIDVTNMKLLGEALINNTTLTDLILRSNNLDDASVELLGKALTKNTALTDLTLGDFTISNTGMKSLIKTLTKHTKLNMLSLVNSNIGDTGLEALSKALTQNTTLTKLVVRDSTFGNSGIKAFSKVLTKNKVLTNLNFGNNKIDDTNVKVIVEGLRDNKVLELLNLASNKITAKGKHAFLNAAINHKFGSQLKIIELSDKFTEKFDKVQTHNWREAQNSQAIALYDVFKKSKMPTEVSRKIFKYLYSENDPLVRHKASQQVTIPFGSFWKHTEQTLAHRINQKKKDYNQHYKIAKASAGKALIQLTSLINAHASHFNYDEKLERLFSDLSNTINALNYDDLVGLADALELHDSNTKIRYLKPHICTMLVALLLLAQVAKVYENHNGEVNINDVKDYLETKAQVFNRLIKPCNKDGLSEETQQDIRGFLTEKLESLKEKNQLKDPQLANTLMYLKKHLNKFLDLAQPETTEATTNSQLVMK